MNDVTTQRPLVLIEAEINFFKEQTANGIIEIGKRLLEAKEQVPHGEWGNWLEEKVDFAQNTANRFMRAAKEFSNCESIHNLGTRKLFLLLDVPQDQREEFTEQNKLEEMTTRQFEAAVKEWKNKAEKAETELQTANRIIKEKKDDIKFLQDAMQEEKDEKEAQIQKLSDELETARIKGMNSKDIDKLQAELDETKRQVEILTDELMNPAEIAAAVVEKVPEEVQQELEALRKFKEAAEQSPNILQPSGTAIVKFKVHFETLVKDFRDLLGTLGEIKADSPDDHVKYQKAVERLLAKMREQI